MRGRVCLGAPVNDDKRTRFPAWITKYALTRGVYCTTVEDHFDISPTFVGDANSSDNFHGNDWHRTRDAAIAHAEAMRTKKIASLKKQIAKLQAMNLGDVK